MKIYLFTYNIKSPKTNLDELTLKLKSFSGWWHYFPTTWLIVSNKSIESLEKEFMSILSLDDSLLIVDITKKDVAGLLPSRAWKWIEKWNKQSPTP